MALDDDIHIMRQVSLFEGLTAEQLRLLAFGSENISVAAGEEIYTEGESADCAYIVTLGQVSLFRKSANERVLVKKAASGAILGELALIAETTRLTDAVADRDSDLMRLNRATFHRILVEYPDVAAALHARISDNLSTMIERISKLAPHFNS